jgi:hypothetical protein
VKPEAQNIALAEWYGWKLADEVDRHGNRFYQLGDQWRRAIEVPTTYPPLPDYVNDLNAISEAESKLVFSKRQRYFRELQHVMSKPLLYGTHAHISECILATAAQRAEALLRTLGKWVEE